MAKENVKPSRLAVVLNGKMHRPIYVCTRSHPLTCVQPCDHNYTFTRKNDGRKN